MAKTFTLQIVTPERVVLQLEVVSVVVPAYDGYLGIMAGHAPLVAELTVGAITVTQPDGHRDMLAVAGGIVSVSDNVATVLADAAELANEIDVQRAEAAQARARQRLEEADEVDTERAKAALMRAINRLKIARKQA